MKKGLFSTLTVFLLVVALQGGEHKQAAHDAQWDYDKHSPEH